MTIQQMMFGGPRPIIYTPPVYVGGITNTTASNGTTISVNQHSSTQIGDYLIWFGSSSQNAVNWTYTSTANSRDRLFPYPGNNAPGLFFGYGWATKAGTQPHTFQTSSSILSMVCLSFRNTMGAFLWNYATNSNQNSLDIAINDSWDGYESTIVGYAAAGQNSATWDVKTFNLQTTTTLFTKTTANPCNHTWLKSGIKNPTGFTIRGNYNVLQSAVVLVFGNVA